MKIGDQTYIRSMYCGQLQAEHIDQEVTLMGWVKRERNLGGCIFIDLRDRTGVVQVVCDPKLKDARLDKASSVRAEWVVAIKGKVVSRGENINAEMPTGAIEVHAHTLEVLADSPAMPFNMDDALNAREELRLKYRYLDLRRAELQEKLVLRHRMNAAVRDYLNGNDFLELETPFLIKSTPEGARDYVVPSRKQPNTFFALPQSPQLFKQLFMVSGFDRYYQIVRCFRDEDLRADRQPEFTQIDLELSFVSEAEIMSLVEGLIANIWKNTIGVEVATPFQRMSYQDAMDNYGVDNPDLRYGLTLKELSACVQDTSFGIIKQVLENQGAVKGICLPDGAKLSRKQIDALNAVVKPYGAGGVLPAKVLEDGSISGVLAKHLAADKQKQLCQQFDAKQGDLLLIVADQLQVVNASLGALRKHLAREFELIDTEAFRFCWITDFPLFQYDEEQARFVSSHHPFTSPREEDIPFLDSDPAHVKARAYDVVCNGHEIGGGSIRINNTELQHKIFEALGIGEQEAQSKFGFFLEALRYGAPPHGGLAFGADRIAMLLARTDAIREVIAFPKTQRATDLMLDAPAGIDASQLAELHLQMVASKSVEDEDSQ